VSTKLSWLNTVISAPKRVDEIGCGDADVVDLQSADGEDGAAPEDGGAHPGPGTLRGERRQRGPPVVAWAEAVISPGASTPEIA
jgi:hypothetical protein